MFPAPRCDLFIQGDDVLSERGPTRRCMMRCEVLLLFALEEGAIMVSVHNDIVEAFAVAKSNR